jgi:drug/metabolite transporter (DMT)-like permease
MKLKAYLPHGCVLAAGILWGCIGLFTRSLTAAGCSVGSIVLLRNCGALALMSVFFLLTDRGVFRIAPRHLPCFLGTGVVSVLLFTLCYFACQRLCSLAVAAVLLYTAPAFVVVFSALLWRERITKRKLLALGLAFLGCVCVAGLGGGLSVTLTGVLLGLGSGLFYGLYSIFGRYALRHYSPKTVTYYTFVFAGAGSLAALRPAELSAAFAAPGTLGLALGLATLSTVAPYLLYTKGLAALDSGRASILASIEPVTAAVVGILAFGEPMNAAVLLGLACIVACVAVLK